jgi:NitT/TauT family transport system substrate-binding protein
MHPTPAAAQVPLASGRRAWLRAAVAAMAAPLLGCAPAPTPLRLACNDWAPYLFAEVERAGGRLDAGVVRLVEMPSSADSLMALNARSVEAAGLTLDELLYARSGGLDVVAVAVCNESHGADMLLAAPRIASLAALRGRRVGVERSAVGALLLKGALRAAGLRPEEIEPVDVPQPRHRAALETGEVDAVVTFGAPARALLAGGARVLFDSAAMPGAIVDVLAVRGDARASHRDGLRALLAAHFAALQAWQRDARAVRPALAARLGVDEAHVDALFDGLTLVPLAAQRQWLNAILPRAAAELQTAMLDNRLLERPAPLNALTDDDHLPPLAAAAA